MIDVDGVPTKVFKHAPPSLREVFATARARERRDLPRLRGRALDLRRGDAPRRRPRRAARRPLRRAARRPRRDRHAQLPRVGHQLRRHHVDRRHLGVAQRVVDRGRARLRPRGLRRHRAHRRRRAGRARPTASATRLGVPRSCRSAPTRCPTASTAGRTSRDLDAPMPDVTVTPTSTPPSSTPRAPPATRRARCRPTGPSSRRSWPSAARPRSTSCAGPTTPSRAGPPAVHPHRPALPRHRLRAGDAVVLRQRAEAGDDVQVGPRARPRADRAGAGHQLRRRPHPELGPARVAALRRRPTRRASSASAAAAPRRRPSW